MAGKAKSWQAIAQHLQPHTTSSAIKSRLDGIVDRRNQIVHEGDLQRLSRPQTPRLKDITTAEATADVDYIDALITAIDAVV